MISSAKSSNIKIQPITNDSLQLPKISYLDKANKELNKSMSFKDERQNKNEIYSYAKFVEEIEDEVYSHRKPESFRKNKSSRTRCNTHRPPQI